MKKNTRANKKLKEKLSKERKTPSWLIFLIFIIFLLIIGIILKNYTNALITGLIVLQNDISAEILSQIFSAIAQYFISFAALLGIIMIYRIGLIRENVKNFSKLIKKNTEEKVIGKIKKVMVYFFTFTILFSFISLVLSPFSYLLAEHEFLGLLLLLAIILCSAISLALGLKLLKGLIM